MKRNFLLSRFVLFFVLFFVFVLPLTPSCAAAVSVDDFWADAADKWGEFIQAGNCARTRLDGDDPAVAAHVYQGENTVAAEYEEAGDGYLALFKSRDPQIIFLGGIKVGDSLNSVLKEKKIPGRMTELNAPKGRQACQWDFGNGITFTVHAQGDSITEFMLYDSTKITPQDFGEAYTDVTAIDYASDYASADGAAKR